jgi:mevalonate kinase
VKEFYAHGKLLLTGEYAITQGANGFAVPTTLGQKLTVKFLDSPNIHWQAYTATGDCWLDVLLSSQLQILKTDQPKEAQHLVKQLQIVAAHSDKLTGGLHFETHLEFDRSWGLGSSSTFTSLLAQFANLDVLDLFHGAHGGSGYDLACASATGPILYHIEKGLAEVTPVKWAPDFADDLAFVFSGKKQLTSESLALVEKQPFHQQQIQKINELTAAFVGASTLERLESVMREHEEFIGGHLGMLPVSEHLFKGYDGAVKSLGGWGGDFVLVTRYSKNQQWLNENGFKHTLPLRTLAVL